MLLGSFWLIQDNCWNGEVGKFLFYDLSLNPYDGWNTVILAGDDRTASLLNLPLHPRGVIRHVAEYGEKFLLELRDKLRAAYQEVQRTHEFGRFQDIYEDTEATVKRFALGVATEIVEVSNQILRKRAASASTGVQGEDLGGGDHPEREGRSGSSD
jgi:hypothetical protein